MKARATIQATKSGGIAMAIMGVIILIAPLPFVVFAQLNFSNLPALFYLVPLGMSLGGIGCIVTGILQFTNRVKFGRVIELESTDSAKKKDVEDRLDELERLKRREMVTPEEYVAKRQEILKDL
jgi:hypothetical protein